MHKMIFQDSAAKYERVTKQAAFKLIEQGKWVALCAHKIRPGYPFAMHCECHKDHLEKSAGLEEDNLRTKWEKYINSFVYYNCNSNETGLYPAFYRVTLKEGRSQ